MTIDFALLLSPEGLALAHRQPSGHWALVAEAKPEGDAFGPAMETLQATMRQRGGTDARVLLVLPDDQVLYTSLMAPTEQPDIVAQRVEDGLEGLTPYAVNELSYEWRAVEIDRVKVAVVAHETLEEATEFAEGFGFQSAGIAAMPPFERFPGMPVFGDTDRTALSIPMDGLAFGADEWGSEAPQAEAAPDPEPEPNPLPEPDPLPEPEGAEPSDAEKPAVEADASEKADADAAPSEEPSAARPADPPAAQDVTDASPAAAEPETTSAKDGDASDSADATPPETPAAPEDDGNSADLLAALVDPSLERPIAPLPKDDEEAEAEAKPKRKGKKRPAPKATKPAEEATTPPRRITPTPSLSDAETKAPRADADAKPGAIPAFAATRGKARAKPTDAPSISARPSRLGFGGATPPPEGQILHPDAAPPVREDPAQSGGRLASQLARVRDASKAKPAAPEPKAPERRASPLTALDTPPASTKAAKGTSDTPPAMGLVARMRRGSDKAATSASSETQTAAAATQTSADTPFTTGLLARKPSEPAGPSFRMGLILTVILLVLLAGIAVWSVLFLPDSPVARFFNGTDATEASLSDDLDAPPAPAVTTVTPGIGARDDGVAVAPAEDTADDAPIEEVAALTPLPDEGPETTEEIAAAPAPAEELPDIDADLELPPLPPLPEELLPSLEETQQIYASDGIWPRTPDRPSFGPFDSADDIYVASIDPAVPGLDAIALPAPGVNPGELLRRFPSPPPFGADLTVDSRGLIEPTPEGALTPEGAFVISGRPAIVAVPRPREIAPEVEVPEINVQDAVLEAFRPTPRPINLEEIRERQVLGGLSVTELQDRRPSTRPLSAQEAAAQASLFPQDGNDDADAPDVDATTATAAATVNPGTALAVASSRMPRLRPGNIAELVASAQRAPAPSVTQVRATTIQPSIPSSASVTRAATERNVMRLRNVNLIGVTGTPSDRRALVRLSSGRFVRVGVGDRLDGGRVAAIGEDTLQYVRNGRNITLDIPG